MGPSTSWTSILLVCPGVLEAFLVQLGGEHLSLAEVGLSLHGLSFDFFFVYIASASLALPSFGFLALPWAFVLVFFFLCVVVWVVVFVVLCVLLPSVVLPFWFPPLWGDCLSFPSFGNLPGVKCLCLLCVCVATVRIVPSRFHCVPLSYIIASMSYSLLIFPIFDLGRPIPSVGV